MFSSYRSVIKPLVLGVALALTLPGQAALFTSTDVPINMPDFGQSGSHVSTLTVSDGALTSITDVNVRLNFTSGDINDIYCYLQFTPTGSEFPITVLLLNQITGTPITSLNVTLDQSAANNIHSASPITDGGSYQPDAGAVTLANYNGWNPNGTWYLYLDDLHTGEVSTLNSWSLEITAVPEPSTWAMGGFGLIFAGTAFYQKQRGRSGKKV